LILINDDSRLDRDNFHGAAAKRDPLRNRTGFMPEGSGKPGYPEHPRRSMLSEGYLSSSDPDEFTD
jgi:hypothetical protein